MWVKTMSNFKSFKKDVLNAITDAEKRALLGIGEVGDGWIKANTPVGQYDDGRVGGNLQGSNGYEIDENQLSVTFYNTAEYAAYVHEGTSRNPRQQPFMRQTIESRINDIKSLSQKLMKL